MTDIVDLEEALSKSGAELFKELYRVYPTADPEDYYKAGQWRNEVMKTDLCLIEAHLRECGSPEPKPIEEVTLPQLPGGVLSAGPVGAVAGGGSALSALSALKTAGAAAYPSPLLSGAATQGSAPVVEIRLIALFVAKWKLDPVMSKTALAKLTPVRRRYVIQNFKAQASGMEATKELEAYIAECETDGSWDSAASNGANGATSTTTPNAAMVAAAAPVRPVVRPGGPVTVSPMLKRPIAPANPAWQMNKRPAFGLGVTPAGMVRPPVAGAFSGIRPAGVVRPVQAKAGGKLISGLLSGF